jgi:hypothetical protein
MAKSEKWMKQHAGMILLIILFGLVLFGVALPERAAGQFYGEGEGTTEYWLSDDEVIIESEVITEEIIIGLEYTETLPFASGPNYSWKKSFEGPGNSYATAMAVDSQRNAVYVTGRIQKSPTDWDYLIIKYRASTGDKLWQDTYDGGVNGFDEARAIAVDGRGNVYVTGYSTGSTDNRTSADFATIAYTPDPNNLDKMIRKWPYPKRYNGPGNWDDFGTAIVVDDRDLNNIYVYVTGQSEGLGGGWDFLTIRYKVSDGTSIARRYNNSNKRHDTPSAIARDSQGNIYVTGCAYLGPTKGYDYCTIKYSGANFTLVPGWPKTYNSTPVKTNAHDYAVGLAVDAQDNIYVTGCSPYTGTGRGYDYLTIAYKSDNTYLWSPITKRYNGLSNDHAFPKAIAVDGNGNVYITGMSFKIGQSANFTTIKYTPGSTTTTWSSYDPGDKIWDEALAIALDAQGNVYVTGSISRSELNSDYCTLKYDGGLNLVTGWTKPDGGSGWDSAAAMALDDSGNIYVTGCSTQTNPPVACTTIKYKP